MKTMCRNNNRAGKPRKLAGRAGAVLAAFMLATSAAPMTAYADGGLDMSTNYPGVAAKPGDTVNFALDFQNSGSGETVGLSAENLPDGFTGFFKGSGNTISSVYAKNGDNDSLVTYTVTVPQDAKEGNYPITLVANGEANSDRLTLNLDVTKEDLGSSTLQTKEGSTSNGTYTYTATIQNNTAETQTYNLSSQQDSGWTVSFQPSGGSGNVSSVDVEAGKSQDLTITVTPPKDVASNDYTIPVTAASGSENLTANLNVHVTGTYNLAVQTQNGTLSFNVKSGKRTPVTVDLVNNGNLELDGINLTSTAPTVWTVEFSESTVDSIAPGETKEVTMYVTPSKSAISGDYVMSVSAANNNTSAQDVQFRVTVKTGTAWGIAGVVIIVAIFACLAGIFKKYGRH